MASEEHKILANIIKDVHASLRQTSLEIGAEEAWLIHCNDKIKLTKYAESMQKLATTHWEDNCANSDSTAISRIKWTADLCYAYFNEELYLTFKKRELDIAKKINVKLTVEEDFSIPLKLIDVGSCYNPFKIYDFFDVLAIDLCPANQSVFECDFLNVLCGNSITQANNKIEQLSYSYFDVVTFCFLLEYIPSSPLRIKACENAYTILKPGGLLIIITPDSKHVGANCKLMKNWRYTLACIGFSRIKYEKFKHMHCMAFRKCLDKDIAVRWATIHKESYMDFALHIPQDFNKASDNTTTATVVTASTEDFNELPFSYLD